MIVAYRGQKLGMGESPSQCYIVDQIKTHIHRWQTSGMNVIKKSVVEGFRPIENQCNWPRKVKRFVREDARSTTASQRIWVRSDSAVVKFVERFDNCNCMVAASGCLVSNKLMNA